MTVSHGRSTLDALEARALRMAAMHSASLHSGTGSQARRQAEARPRLLNRLKTQRILLHDAYLLFVRITEQGELHSPAAEWLLDNYYIVQAAIRQIVQDLPEKYYRQLPRLETTRLAGRPRVYAIARELVFSQDGRVDLEQVEVFVNAYQNVIPLTMGELWAIPIMLRFNLVEALTQAATRALDIDALDEGGALDEITSSASPDAVIANCITSLRAISSYSWQDFFEGASLVERILNGDPARVYPRMDFASRNHYRSIIERYSRETGLSQPEIARQAIALARFGFSETLKASVSAQPTDQPHDPRLGHVGYYLVSGGRRQLEEVIKYHPPGIRRARRWMVNHPTRAYLGAVGLLTLLVLLVVLLLSLPQAPSAGRLLLVLAFSFLPTLGLAVSLINWGVMQFLPPRRLPRLAFSRHNQPSQTSRSAGPAQAPGIPDEYRAVVVIPTLLTSRGEVDSLLSQLEQHYLRNGEPNLAFGLLSDFSDAPHEVMPGDEVLMERALTGLQELQQRYPGTHFFLLHRARRWNPQENVWMGWERKRGKLEEFNRLLTGAQDTSFTVQAGSLTDFLKQPVRYVITLDSDTILPSGSAAALVGVMAHPLNQARFDPVTGRVTSGYTILQPRSEIRPESAAKTRFTRIFSGDTGIDLYSLAVSDVYQDLFGEGIFVGKGIYDLHAFMRSTHNQVPENSILSHDLLEGLLGRAGLVSDIVVYESYPPTYLAYLYRWQRWIRGDWQLLPWLFGLAPSGATKEQVQERRRLKMIDRWKIIDNLRRSLAPSALLALVIAGWLVLPGSPLAWTLFAFLTTLGPLAAGLAGQRIRSHLSAQPDSTPHPWGLTRAERNQFTRWILSWIFLPHEARLALDAILITLGRMLFSQRKMLEWTTAASVARQFGSNGAKPTLPWREMGSTLLLSLALIAVAAFLRPGVLPLVIFFTLVWLAAPWVIAWLDQSPKQVVDTTKEEDIKRLRRLARRTWYFFERFVGPGDHWLPPDHFQQVPRGQVAHRTSTTNIGLGMLSTLAACDLGYNDTAECLQRIRSMFTTLDNLEKHRGHFLNWYDTRTLQPLPQRYISTVDNGNLAGCMLALRQGLLDLTRRPLVRWERWQGLLDTLAVFREVLQTGRPGEKNWFSAQPPHFSNELDAQLAAIEAEIESTRDKPGEWPNLLERVRTQRWPQVQDCLLEQIDLLASRLDPRLLQSLRIWSERIHFHLASMQREERQSAFFTRALANPPRLLSEIEPRSAINRTWIAIITLLSPQTCPECLLRDEEDIRRNIDRLRGLLLEENFPSRLVQEALDWCDALITGFDTATSTANDNINEIESLVGWLDRCLATMDFRFLYNPQRELFSIGYNVDSGQMDANEYDLLASESRIASLVAIARGDVPYQHWLSLGRQTNLIGEEPVLLSWSGTMFEYLMPPIMLRELPNTLLYQSARAAVRAQIEHGEKNKVPWGVSESGFYYFDANQNYQYRAFGVPGLGFKRGLSDDLVVTPYACLLALPYAPRAVLENLTRLDKLEMLSDFGYYEAIDFTPARLPLGQAYARVASFMAHHQGMILLALANHLQDNCFVERFHANPIIQSAELLLQEQVPQTIVVEQLSEEEEIPPPPQVETTAVGAPWTTPVENSPPRVHYLTNGRYAVLITNHGSGYSAWQGPSDNTPRALTRWRADTTRDEWGSWIYLQDLDQNELWTVGGQLLPVPGGTKVYFAPNKVDFHNSLHGLDLHLQVAVHPVDDLEIRVLRLNNRTDSARRVSLTSYGEVVLTSLDADRRHPAFQKMMVESEVDPQANALIFHRRPRAASDQPVYLLHSVVLEPGRSGQIVYESDRGQFIGRGRTVRSPQALAPGSRLAGKSLLDVGAMPFQGQGTTETGTLDPIFALQHELVIAPHTQARVAFLTAAGPSRPEVLTIAQRFADWGQIERAFDQAQYAAELELRRLMVATPGTGAAKKPEQFLEQDLEHYQNLLSTLLYPQSALRAAPELLNTNTLGQPGLWSFGISGDFPILLLKIGQREERALLRQVLQAHAFWRNRGLLIDLVILTEKQSGYGQEVHDRVFQSILRGGHGDWVNRRGGIFLLQQAKMDEASLALLHTAARAILIAGAGPLNAQLRVLDQIPLELPAFVPVPAPPASVANDGPVPPLARPEGLRYDNGWGGFSEDGSQYLVYLTPNSLPPAPWINVIANPQCGFWVSEAGGGYTWAANSGENRLTPWSNDPVSDSPGEALYLRDEETADIWSPTPLPAGEDLPYLVSHSPGSTLFTHHSHGLRQELRLFVHRDLPVKIIHLRLHNFWQRPRRITATYYAEWALGVNRDQSQQYILPEYDYDHRALLARNPYNPEFGQRIAFLAAGQEMHSLTTSRREFLGQNGDMRRPAGLLRVGLTGQAQAGADPCAALQVHINLPAGGDAELFFLLGQGDDRAASLACIEQVGSLEQVHAAFDDVTRFWQDMLGTVQAATPDPAMDFLLNRWLLYQDLACRIWGRSALYQSSGAFGFRDQLQDVMALLLSAPGLARQHILRTAQYQFSEGDVLHWWHPPAGRGVRTRHSDDLLWLPFVTAEYITATGDAAILDETIPFLVAEPLKEDEEDRYGLFPATEEGYPLYEHCLRAIQHASTAGPHGLPLFGAGDWNDGMNRVGAGGVGESVWLGWFLIDVLRRFIPICQVRGDAAQAAAFVQQAAALRKALHEHAWDGAWFLRGFYDTGQPLGSAKSDECKIDSIAQSWSVLSGAGASPDEGTPAEAGRPSSIDISPPIGGNHGSSGIQQVQAAAGRDRSQIAMQSVLDRLVQADGRLLRLFTPPFDRTALDPGYIKAYPPGVRENGGQYTHAALWSVWAFTQLGQGDTAGRLFDLLNPITHGSDPSSAAGYRVEPYVVAADVYSEKPHTGRGGWTWYTGSAGWMYRLGIEAILGLRRRGSRLIVDPCIPATWPGYNLQYRFGGTLYRIEVKNPGSVECGVAEVTLDGLVHPDLAVPLVDDGQEHTLIVTLGPGGARPSLTQTTVLERLVPVSGSKLVSRRRKFK